MKPSHAMSVCALVLLLGGLPATRATGSAELHASLELKNDTYVTQLLENVEAFKEEMGLLLNKMQRVVTTTGMMDATEGDGEAEVQATARLYVLNTSTNEEATDEFQTKLDENQINSTDINKVVESILGGSEYVKNVALSLAPAEDVPVGGEGNVTLTTTVVLGSEEYGQKILDNAEAFQSRVKDLISQRYNATIAFEDMGRGDLATELSITFVLSLKGAQTNEVAERLVGAYLEESSLDDQVDKLNAALEEEFGPTGEGEPNYVERFGQQQNVEASAPNEDTALPEGDEEETTAGQAVVVETVEVYSEEFRDTMGSELDPRAAQIAAIATQVTPSCANAVEQADAINEQLSDAVERLPEGTGTDVTVEEIHLSRGDEANQVVFRTLVTVHDTETDADAKDRLETSLQSIDTEQLIEMINENFERLPPELLPGADEDTDIVTGLDIEVVPKEEDSEFGGAAALRVSGLGLLVALLAGVAGLAVI